MVQASVLVRSTTASGSAVYESKRAVYEYLQFHYGTALVPYSFAPLDALDFLPRTVERCASLTPTTRRTRALDIGCAVGRATFELSKFYDEVLGIDFSQPFVDAANQMKERGETVYEAHIQGDIREERCAKLPEGVKPSSVLFQQGDACNLPLSLGKFDAVFASNLLCRLPEPQKFLTEIGRFINSGGVLALVSPYSWLEEYTAKDKWIGGVRDTEGNIVDSFSVIEQLLSKDFELLERQDYPFMIREHERKYQWGVSDGTYWKRK
uniref:Methyltransferase type 11 domain-containing protein n=1 Tax=Peronospora matthiolae TaxID=2874970 RepID=A0AAV1T851_9STRA